MRADVVDAAEAIIQGALNLNGDLIGEPSRATLQRLFEEALGAQKQSGEKLGYVLVSLGYVKEDEITQLLSEQYGVPSINLRHFEIDESVINLIPSEVSQKYLVLPVNRRRGTPRPGRTRGRQRQAPGTSGRCHTRPNTPPRSTYSCPTRPSRQS